MPAGLATLSARAMTGRLQVMEQSGPEGAHRYVTAAEDQDLLFTEFWQSSPEPHVLDLGNGPRIVQVEPGQQPGPAGGYTEVELRGYEGDRLIATIPIGQPTVLRTNTGQFQAYVEVSDLLTTPEGQPAVRRTPVPFGVILSGSRSLTGLTLQRDARGVSQSLFILPLPPAAPEESAAGPLEGLRATNAGGPRSSPLTDSAFAATSGV